ncbi:MAG: CNT family concentrative nucleoside transporter, partial [Parvicellaceae bacterium]
MSKSVLKYFFFIGALVLLLSSCAKESSVEHKLKRNWTVDVIDDLDGNRINLKENGQSHPWLFSYNKGLDQNYYERIYSEGDTIGGSWNLINDSTLSIQIIDRQTVADSIETQFGRNGETGVALFDENGSKIGQLDHEGNFKASGERLQFQILNISESYLALQDQHAIYHLYYDSPDQASYVSFETISRGLMGMLFLIVVAYLLSSNRKAINWNLVIKGLILQAVIAILVLKVPFISSIFDSIALGFKTVTEYTSAGSEFLFQSFVDGEEGISSPLINFAFTILPTIVFFSALMSLLYYWGILQKFVWVFAWVMKKFMKLSGAESLAAAGNVFLGQTESPLLVKPYLMGMSKSEMNCLMTGGMATVAGGVLASYISFLGGGDPAQEIFYAKHLLTASIISAPAAIIAAKMLVPETETINQELKISNEKLGSNSLEAIANGTTDGLKLAVNVGAMLLVFTALIALANGLIGGFGDIINVNDAIAESTHHDKLSLEMILGYICGPFMWVMGVETADMWAAGELLGIKTVSNEFMGY